MNIMHPDLRKKKLNCMMKSGNCPKKLTGLAKKERLQPRLTSNLKQQWKSFCYSGENLRGKGDRRMLSASEIVALQRQITAFRFEQWRHESLFSLQWWFLVSLLTIPWPIWLKLVDRKRILEISLFGVVTIGLITILDAVGMEFGLWGYKYNFLPVLPLLLPMDFSILSVSHMLIYQYFRPWKSFIIALTIVGCVFAFIGEPFMEYIGIYQRYEWEYIYSLPIYVGKAVVCRLLVTKIMKLNQEV